MRVKCEPLAGKDSDCFLLRDKDGMAWALIHKDLFYDPHDTTISNALRGGTIELEVTLVED